MTNPPKPFLLSLAILFTTLGSTRAFDVNEDIKFATLAHMHFAASQSDTSSTLYGFRLRRLDFRVWEPHETGLEWSLLLGFSDFRFKILEADIAYNVSPALKFKIGQFIPPGARSAISMDFRYSAVTMPFIERSMVTLNWVNHSRLNAYRTFGFLTHGKVLNNRLYYAAMFATPDGSHFFYPSNRETIQSNPLNGYALWSRLEYSIKEDFDIGAFGNRIEINTNTEIRDSYGAHIIYKSKGFKFMSEYITGSISQKGRSQQSYNGIFAEISQRWKKVEPALRFDVYQPYNGAKDNLGFSAYQNYTAGINFYPMETVRIQCNYLTKLEQRKELGNPLQNNILYVNFQLFMK